MKLKVRIQIKQQLTTIFLQRTRQSAEVTANTLQLLFNNAISSSEFRENLRLTDVTPIFKEKDPLDKTNYRPVSVLPLVSKIFERLMQEQINVI